MVCPTCTRVPGHPPILLIAYITRAESDRHLARALLHASQEAQKEIDALVDEAVRVIVADLNERIHYQQERAFESQFEERTKHDYAANQLTNVLAAIIDITKRLEVLVEVDPEALPAGATEGNDG